MKSAHAHALALALLVIARGGAPARAQDTAPEEGPPTDTVLEAELRALHLPASRIEDDGDARLAVTRALAATSLTFSPVTPLRITLELDAEHSRYDWDDAADLPFDDVGLTRRSLVGSGRFERLVTQEAAPRYASVGALQ